MLLRTPILILVTLGLAQDPGPTAPTADTPGQRVILEVGRNRHVRGYVTLEDTEVIVVRGADSTLQSYPKSRVLRIVRLVDPKPGQTGVVFLRNGQRRRGVILEDVFDHVLIDINGIRTRLVRETVDHVLLQPTFEQRYERYRASARTSKQKLQLCQWLVDERRYELAAGELSELVRESSEPEAARLLTIVTAQLALGDTGQDPEAAGPGDDADRAGAVRLPSQILSFEDVNLIRVYEIDFDRPPNVSVDPATIHKMIELYGTNRAIPASERERRALFRADSLEIVELLFTLKARDLYPRVHVVSEPYALNLFRRRVHNAWLLNSCATARCHGGVDAGRFFLHRRGYKDERVRYTNLLILERQEVDPEWPLVNYAEPMMSLIIQYGMPRHLARRPHPDAKGWTPVFGRGGQRMLRETVSWIETMMRPRPQYPVDYQPPRLASPADSASPPGDDDRAPR
ncbi:MAG: hypothetical protein IID28_00410 [Planctomycetes bacterium]|nr:hypothetical protein [Planctomycetota bacterium]